MYKQTLPIILASKSPRRQELMKAMDLEFKVEIREVDESYPAGLAPAEIAVFISEKKAMAFPEQTADHIVITADTIVASKGQILGKPADSTDAVRMLKQLSGEVHHVFTGVTISYRGNILSFYDETEVVFRELTDEQINYYVEQYNPLDKAGSYGIQDWIGMVGVERISGSYTNVMGLPTEKLYQTLLAI
ncbi:MULTISPECIES: Maf family protein [Pedobacter]|uniref:Maf family protein n=1 Tax=Pedobacter TaxID=84567 RepID=UPI00210E05FB|nr:MULTISPECIES: Maf family nucleotide pyrophosphatase [unclassified Pedobacter]